MNALTMKEFTKKAGVSRQTVYDWMKRGFIKQKRFGMKILFTDKDLSNVPNIKKILKNNQHRL